MEGNTRMIRRAKWGVRGNEPSKGTKCDFRSPKKKKSEKPKRRLEKKRKLRKKHPHVKNQLAAAVNQRAVLLCMKLNLSAARLSEQKAVVSCGVFSAL